MKQIVEWEDEKFDFDIRYSELEDGNHLKNWLKDPEDLKWYPVSEKKEIESTVNNWIGFSKFRASLTAIHEDQVIGIATLFLMPYKKVSHHSLFYIMVHKKFRKKGVGTSLVKNILNLAKVYFKLESVHCEIYVGSSILSILQKLNFQSFALQENYVKNEGTYLARNLLEHYFD